MTRPCTYAHIIFMIHSRHPQQCDDRKGATEMLDDRMAEVGPDVLHVTVLRVHASHDADAGRDPASAVSAEGMLGDRMSTEQMGTERISWERIPSQRISSARRLPMRKGTAACSPRGDLSPVSAALSFVYSLRSNIKSWQFRPTITSPPGARNTTPVCTTRAASVNSGPHAWLARNSSDAPRRCAVLVSISLQLQNFGVV